MSSRFDIVIVGAGIAGAALATVLARAGKSVLLLERSTVYRDRVRGEAIVPWGVAEAHRLQLRDVLERAGGAYMTRFVGYDETHEPSVAESKATPLDTLVDGAPGVMGISHPAACAALAEAAAAAGATVVYGLSDLAIGAGPSASVRYTSAGTRHDVTCRLIVGADGRDSTVRQQAGISLFGLRPRLAGAGLLVEDLRAWPTEQMSAGTEGDLIFYVIPQGSGRVRLYLFSTTDQRYRFAGPRGAQAFLEAFHFKCIPQSDRIVAAHPAGPCAVYPMRDTWTSFTVIDGIALIGDAAGYSDPQIGQGLAVALRDARVLGELLLAQNDWNPGALAPYVKERRERMRRLRACADFMFRLRAGFGPIGRERRREAARRMFGDPELGLWRSAIYAGPETVPGLAFDSTIGDRLFAA
ncbi:MAG: FAD-dependent monooxygenase [Mycobacterium sp.]|nr:FAD-dependent monooxygenase [Mycobacterium sp.]